MDTRVLLPVRILYTINSSPQYILARAPAKVRCTPISATAATHAQCSLKTCLATICRASPELVQDSARDFSVYVLDPLESAAPASSSTLLHTPGQSTSEIGNADAGGSSHGVAVGMGLMSWALLAEEEEGEEACVTGTLVVGAGVQSLQVVFALRETTHMHKGNLSPALKYWSRPPSTRASDTASAHDLSTVNNTTKPKLTPKPTSSGSSRPNHTTISDTQHVNNHPHQAPVSRLPTTPPRPDMIPGSDPAYAIDLTASPSPQRHRASAFASTSTPSSLPFYSHSQSHAGTGPLTFRPLSRRRPLDVAYAPPYGIAGRPKAPAVLNAEQARLKEKERLRNGKVDKRSREWRRKEKAAMEHSPVAPRHAHPSSHAQREREGRLDEVADNGNEGEMERQRQDQLSLLLAALSASSTSTTPQMQTQTQTAAPPDTDPNAALLTALASIDSGFAGEASVNPALVTALRALLGSAPAEKPANGGRRPKTRSSGAVASEDGEDADDPDWMEDDEEDGDGGDESAPPPSQPRAKEKENVSPKWKKGHGPDAKKRKRRLSDFMEQKEREQALARGGKRRSFGGAANASAYDTWSEGAGGVPRERGVYYDSFGAHARTSPIPEARVLPPTPAAPGLGLGLGLELGLPRTMSVGSTASVSTPGASQDENAENTSEGGSKKKFVLPAWARTTTTTQPRLSEEAIRAQRERAEEEALMRRKHRKEGEDPPAKRGRKGGEREAAGREAAQAMAVKESAKAKSARVEQEKKKPTSSPSLGLPVCASSDVTVVAPSSPRPAPQTPPPRPRRKHMLTPLTKSAGGGSGLFTPSPRKVSAGGGVGLFGSPLYSPCMRASVKKVFSPMRAEWLREPKDRNTARDDEDEEERLARELDSDTPSSSLPVASSESEAELPRTSSSEGRLSVATEPGADEGGDGDTTMRFWTAGLPPSSPPPPTSPVLHPEDDDTFGTNWMSDSDGLAFEYDSDAPMNLGEPLDDFYASASDGPTMSFEEFNQLFSDPAPVPAADADAEACTPIQSADFDFGQFWETIKPLMNSQDQPPTTDVDAGVDPVRLAEDVHALFSGCLM